MATKYSDIVDLRSGRSTYYLEEEKAGDWSVFIVNDQFNDILRTVVRSVMNNDLDAHKSFWIEGTYGTGKTHAGAVLKHLLCDDISAIEEWLLGEYKLPKFEGLCQSVFDLRKKKRLFPVTLYGASSIAHPDDLSLQLQQKIQEALIKAGLTDLEVKTDYDTYIKHIDENQQFWEMLIEQSPKLSAVTPNVDKLRKELSDLEPKILRVVQDALRDAGFHIRMENANITQWFFEVQEKLKEKTEYDGLLIIWDEFTTLLTLDIGLNILVQLQELTERAMAQENDSYFLFISHPSALNSLKAEERQKTIGRYHYMKYNMEPVSAYKIMSRKFRMTGTNEEYLSVFSPVLDKFDNLINHYTENLPNAVETTRDIKSLMPVHPATALLATFYAREAGSSSRSVFQFLGENETVREFLNNEVVFAKRDTITADFLWDYVIGEFNENVTKFGAVTERYNTYCSNIENEGEVAMKVFKGTLLLNALNNIANHKEVTPSEENILRLFEGTSFAEQVVDVLTMFDNKGYIQRAPGNVFSIQFTALPTKEIEDAKESLRNREFKYLSQVLTFNDSASKEVDKILINLCRPYTFKFYSLDINEYTLFNKIENGRKDAKGYELFLALLFGKTTTEIQTLREYAEHASVDPRFADTCFIVFDAPFGEKEYERFIEYQANAKCAQKFNFTDQYQAHVKNAASILTDYIIKNVRRENFYLYLGESHNTYSASKLTSTLDRVIAPRLFCKGPEALEQCVGKSKTYWKKESTKKIVQLVLSFNTKTDIINQLNAQQSLVKILLEASVDENLEFKPDIDQQRNPLYLVYKFVEDKIKRTDKQNLFNLAEKFEELSYPPYGLFQTCSCMAMLAFALRPYIGKMFDTNGKPREAQHLVEDVVATFDCWEKGNKNPKISFKFETKEEGQLCKSLIKCFSLDSLNGYHDISSLKDARWAILHEYSVLKGYPLWALKYAIPATIKNAGLEEPAQKLIDDVLTICFETTHRNPSMMVDIVEGIKSMNFEIRAWFKDNTYFKQGFEQFLMSEPNVALQSEDLDKAFAFIKQNMQGEIGLWGETEVLDQLKNWALSQKPAPTPTPPIQPIPGGAAPIPPVPPTAPAPGRREQAKEKVQFINNVEDAKDILLRLIELDMETIIDTILE